jgi:hypothetical protein
MRTFALACFIAFLTTSVSHGAPDDGTLSRLLVGEWQGARHAVQYMKDGTWRFAPAEGTTHGKWKIQHGKLIETWRFVGNSEDSSATYDIVVLNGKILKLRDGKGTLFISNRVPRS